TTTPGSRAPPEQRSAQGEQYGDTGRGDRCRRQRDQGSRQRDPALPGLPEAGYQEPEEHRGDDGVEPEPLQRPDAGPEVCAERGPRDPEGEERQGYPMHHPLVEATARSEERRVGKEWRCRG